MLPVVAQHRQKLTGQNHQISHLTGEYRRSYRNRQAISQIQPYKESARKRTLSYLSLVAVSTLAISLVHHRPYMIRGQTGGVAQLPAGGAQGAAPQTLFCGLWRVDGDFTSTIHIKNSLVVGPIEVTPVLYMADGTGYALPPVNLPTSGVASVSVNQALANAPPELARHQSQFGSAALRYQYASPGHVLGSLEILNVGDSLIFTYPFSGVAATRQAQTWEGLWWRHDPGVGGFVALSNTTGGPMEVTLQAIGSRGTALPAEALTIAAHSTQLLDLDSLVNGLSGLENQAGGLRVKYDGSLGGVIVAGGLTNEREGYSANIPFWQRILGSSEAAKITYASVGMLVGDAMPESGFPTGTHFEPYAVLRNTTAEPLDVSVGLNFMAGGAPSTLNPAPFRLKPFETMHVELKHVIASLGLERFSGSINLEVSFTGHGGDLVLATGSVDQTGTYVFEVLPEAVGKSFGKQDALWTVASGFDTMYTLWNPTDRGQDFVATFFYGDGSGKYELPIHLGGQGSITIDMARLIAAGQPDPLGHVIPASVQQGSTEFVSAKGRMAWMTLVVSANVFNVQNATCGACWINCCGFSAFTVSPSTFSCPVGLAIQLAATATDCTGGVTDFTSSCTWSSNNTAVGTVNSTGLVNGVSPGSCGIAAQFQPVVIVTGLICGTPAVCITAREGAGSSGTIDSFQFTITSGGVPNDNTGGRGIIANQPFTLQIQALNASGAVDTNYNQTLAMGVQPAATAGETVPSSVTFSQGTATANITLWSASGGSSFPSSLRTITVGSGSAAFGVWVHWRVTMDYEAWKNPGFTSCPNAGSYYCQTACDPNGFAQPTSFIAMTGKVCHASVSVEAQHQDFTWSGFVSTTQEDCGPAVNGTICVTSYWFSNSIPSIGGCLSDQLFTTLGNPLSLGHAPVLWRFNN